MGSDFRLRLKVYAQRRRHSLEPPPRWTGFLHRGTAFAKPNPLSEWRIEGLLFVLVEAHALQKRGKYCCSIVGGAFGLLVGGDK